MEVLAQGKTATFLGPLSTININPGGGNSVVNAINILGAPPGATISVKNSQGAHNNIQVGHPGLGRLANTIINIQDSTGATVLSVDDTGDIFSRITTVT